MTRAPTYAELQVTTNFSFLRGGSHPHELVAAAAGLGLAALGVADRNTLAGVVRAYAAAGEAGLRLLVGARLDFADGTPSVLCYPTDRAAYGRLTKLLSQGQLRAEKGECELLYGDLLEHGEGQVLIVVPPRPLPPPPCGEGVRGWGSSGQAVRSRIEPLSRSSRPILERSARADDPHPLTPSPQGGGGSDFPAALLRFARDFPGSVYLAATRAYGAQDARRLHRLAALAAHAGTPLVATGDVLYHSPARRPLQDVLTCIREKCTIHEAGLRLEANAERHLKSPAEMARLFAAHPEAIARTLEIAARCTFSLSELRYEYPDEPVPPGKTAQEHLEDLTWAGAARRYPQGVPEDVKAALRKELAFIAERNLPHYFLTVYDIVRFAREVAEPPILCQGRGSAANSAVCFCLGVTPVDPTENKLLFERFMSKERDEPPDIDVDFEHERREEVIQYIYRRYGRERAAICATVIHYRPRSAIRDVGKALGLSEDITAALANTVWGSWGSRRSSEADDEEEPLDDAPPSPTTEESRFPLEVRGDESLAGRRTSFEGDDRTSPTTEKSRLPLPSRGRGPGGGVLAGRLPQNPREAIAPPPQTAGEVDAPTPPPVPLPLEGRGDENPVGRRTSSGIDDRMSPTTEESRLPLPSRGRGPGGGVLAGRLPQNPREAIAPPPRLTGEVDAPTPPPVPLPLEGRGDETHAGRSTSSEGDDRMSPTTEESRLPLPSRGRGSGGGLLAGRLPQKPREAAPPPPQTAGDVDAPTPPPVPLPLEGRGDETQAERSTSPPDENPAGSGTSSRASPGMPDAHIRQAGLDPQNEEIRRAVDLATELLGFPRHLSQHVGGFVLTKHRLDETVPIGNAAMEDRTFIEWDKDDIDALGLMKVDVLALGMLTCIRRGLDLLKTHHGVDFGGDIARIPREDKAVFDMLSRGDSVGVFQVESRAQMSMLPRLRPQTFYDLVIEVAIVRPGPIQGDMVHPYLRRRAGLEPVEFPSPAPEHGPADELEQILGRTLGVPLFQEQAMSIAIEAAKFTPEEANGLRRAMATFRSNGSIYKYEEKFISRMISRGYAPDFAERCFHQIEGFGSYGFPESHAASFAKLVYASAWIKHHYPDVFCAAILNSQPMGFYQPAQLVRDAREHGVEVRQPDIWLSEWDCTLEAPFPDPGGASLQEAPFRDPNGERLSTPPPLEGEGVRGWGGGASLRGWSQEAGAPPPAQAFDPHREHPAPSPPPPPPRGEGEAPFPHPSSASLQEAPFRDPNGERLSTPPPLEGEGAGGRGGGASLRRQVLEAGAPPPAQAFDPHREHPAPSPPPPRGEGEAPFPHPGGAGPSPPGGGGSAHPPRPKAVRLGLRLVSGLSQAEAEKLVAARKAGAQSLEALARAAGLARGVLERIAEADAFRSKDLDRRQALWRASGLKGERGVVAEAPLLALIGPPPDDDEGGAALPPMPLPEHVAEDYRTIGLSLKAHPCAFFRRALEKRGVLASADLARARPGSKVRVAGLVLNRQRPGTAKNVMFATLEDETGIANLVIWDRVFQEQRRVLMTASFLLVLGEVQKASDVIHVIVERAVDLSSNLARLRGDDSADAKPLQKSRDFH